MFRKFVVVVFLILAVAFLKAPALAEQRSNSGLMGTVKCGGANASSAVVKVQLLPTTNSVTDKTNALGQYKSPLAPGT
ncbi:MAG: hypothetical protein ACHQT7_02910 [Candidatus Levyibacteriota bacterium]